MGQDFEVSLSCNLSADTPQHVLDTLRYMMRTEEYEFDSPPAHPFFRISIHGFDGEWRKILRGPSIEPTPYLPGCFGCRLGRTYPSYSGPDLRDELVAHALSLRVCNDDYMLDVYKSFLQWLAEYSEIDGFVGYYRLDNDDFPTLLFFSQGRVLEFHAEGELAEITTRHDFQR
jgi:hypothetical protein